MRILDRHAFDVHLRKPVEEHRTARAPAPDIFDMDIPERQRGMGKESSERMEDFRFAVMGAGNIAKKFCEAVRLAGYEKTDVPLSKGKIQELRSMYEF